jgi:hypothetical protein
MFKCLHVDEIYFPVTCPNNGTLTCGVTVAYSNVKKVACWINACGSYSCAACVSGGVAVSLKGFTAVGYETIVRCKVMVSRVFDTSNSK